MGMSFVMSWSDYIRHAGSINSVSGVRTGSDLCSMVERLRESIYHTQSSNCWNHIFSDYGCESLSNRSRTLGFAALTWRSPSSESRAPHLDPFICHAKSEAGGGIKLHQAARLDMVVSIYVLGAGRVLGFVALKRRFQASSSSFWTKGILQTPLTSWDTWPGSLQHPLIRHEQNLQERGGIR